ncbi:hypothetical protein Tco_1398478, partial [Tanacetum coccineum]
SFVKLFVKLFVGIFWKAKQSDQLEWVLWYAPWLSDQLECGLAGRMVTLRVSTAGAKGVTTGTLVSIVMISRMLGRVARETLGIACGVVLSGLFIVLLDTCLLEINLVPSANLKMWSVSSNSPMLSFLKRYSGIMFTHDPKSVKVSKGFESPNLQGRVNSPGSSILADTSPWTNADLFLPSYKLSTYLSNIAL